LGVADLQSPSFPVAVGHASPASLVGTCLAWVDLPAWLSTSLQLTNLANQH